MRFAAAVLLVCVLAMPAAEQNDAFFPVAIEYPLSAGAPLSTIVRDLQAVHGAGFNAIQIIVTWRDIETVRGTYAVEAIERTIAQADQSGLRVIVAIDHAAPGWVFERYGRTRDACFDHPGVRADLIAFVKAIATRASRYRALLAIDVGSRSPALSCLVPATGTPVPARLKRRDDLADLARAAASSGVRTSSRTSSPSVLRDASVAQDDWLMAGVVDIYGLTLTARAPFRLAADDLAGASRGRGWWAGIDASVPEPDRRLATWMALSRGAQGLIFDDPPFDVSFVQTLVRNPALFTQLRPRRARVALLFDPLMAAAQPDLLIATHQALYDRQIAVDILNAEQLGAADLSGYRAIVGTSPRALPAGARDAMAVARAAGAAFVDARGGRARDAVLEAGVSPDVRVEGGTDIEVRFLESPTVQMIIALNHAAQSQRVTMTFAPDTQEAIWVNMETGTGVNFVAGASGPVHQYWFRPKDALVLMIRKDIR